MVDGFLHIYEIMKPFAIVLSEAGRGMRESGGGDLTNVQCKAIQNCHNEKWKKRIVKESKSVDNK
jgi:hypothetical protein